MPLFLTTKMKGTKENNEAIPRLKIPLLKLNKNALTRVNSKYFRIVLLVIKRVFLNKNYG